MYCPRVGDCSKQNSAYSSVNALFFCLEVRLLANTENLVSLADRTTEEQRAIASAGGKASGEARRKRKTLKEELLLMLSEGETQQSVTFALIEKAMSGDTKAFEVIRDTIGEKPIDKVMIADVDPSVIAEVEAMVLTDYDTATGG